MNLFTRTRTVAIGAVRTATAVLLIVGFSSVTALQAASQVSDDPFPDPIPESEGAIVVNFEEFAELPDFDGEPARMMLLSDEPGSGRLFVVDMWGILYSVGYEGGSVTPYLDLYDSRWGIDVETSFFERGFQSFAFHPQFTEEGTPGYGKFYTYVDVIDMSESGDFDAPGDEVTHHTLLQEWTAEDPEAETYDGGPPRTLIDLVQPFVNHNAGQLAFNPTAAPGDPDFGALYVGVADGGSGGDPLNLSLNLGSGFGKIFRIDPLGSNSANGEYGIPSDNPFVGRTDALDEIYAYGARNPQRFAWDPVNGNLFMADIGQNTIEKLTLVPRGANLGWNEWEGSFRYVGREGVEVSDPRSDPDVVYPVVEYAQPDPLLISSSAITGVHVYRSEEIPALADKVLFGDNPIGEVFHISADDLPDGGQDAIRRVLFNDGGETKRLLQLVQEKNVEQGREPTNRVNLRFGSGPDGQVFLLNKFDNVIRRLVP